MNTHRPHCTSTMVRTVLWLLIAITYIHPLNGSLENSVWSLEGDRTGTGKQKIKNRHSSPGFGLGGISKLISNNPGLNLATSLLEKTPLKTYFGSGASGQNNKQSGWPLKPVTFDHPIQSPVDVVTSKAIEMNLPVLDIIEPDNKGVQAKFYNSGHTVYVYVNEDPIYRPSLIGGPLKTKFIFEQMHFHWGREDIWGSEHFIDGESFAVEIHLVHYNSSYESFEVAATKKDGLSVLTLFAEAQESDNPLLEPLHKLLPKISEPKTAVLLNAKEAMQWAVSALTINNDYFTYPGSLTTDPYSENVIFILLPQPIKLSFTQLQSFRSLHDEHEGKIVDNKRNLQPLHNRPIVRSSRLQKPSTYSG